MSRRTQKNVGVIGLGIIGTRVADNLRRRGFHAFVWNRTPRPYPNFVGSPSEVAELCDFVQIFVSDDEALMQMVQEMKRSLKAHHVIMAHSTVAPYTMRAAAEVVQRRGAQFLDAPFTGSKGAAEKGELVYYVGGDDAAFRRAQPVLQASSKEIIEIGEIGQATTIKVATNMVTAATVQAAAEALALVHSSGLSPDKFETAMRGNASNSTVLGMKLPKMLAGDFEPHFSVKNMLKDVQIAARLGRSHGLRFGATEAARDSLLEEAERGRAAADYSSLSRTFFPDRAPLEPVQAESDGEEQATLAGLDEPVPAELPVEKVEVAEATPVEAAAATPALADVDAENAESGPTRDEPASPEIGADEKGPVPGDSITVDEPADHDDEKADVKAPADDEAAEKEELEIVVKADSDSKLSVEQKTPDGAEAELTDDNPPAEDKERPAAPEQAATSEKVPAEEPPPAPEIAEPAAVLEPAAATAGDKEEAGARRGFFGRMFGRGGGDY